MIGEGFSGLIPAIGSLAQGVGGNPYCKNVTVYNETKDTTEYVMQKVVPEPRFSVEVFFYFLAGMMLVSAISFMLLNYLPQIRTEYAEEHQQILFSHTPNHSQISSRSASQGM